MRTNPPYKEGTVQAIDARIFWDVEPDRVAVVPWGKPIPADVDRWTYSGGACYGAWKTACGNENAAMIICLRAFWDLVYLYDIDPEIVDDALSCIIEYQKAFNHLQRPMGRRANLESFWIQSKINEF